MEKSTFLHEMLNTDTTMASRPNSHSFRSRIRARVMARAMARAKLG